uniref:Myeloid protein 1-like n=1 Tax=Echeneis naucrates TaxID=173247 RepID=A0A665VKK5_ECHNA
MVVFLVIYLASLSLLVSEGESVHLFCRGNPSNEKRTSDMWGSGHYGASRGDRIHKGVDIRCEDGDDVLAPFDVTLEGALSVFTDPKMAAINSGINLRGKGLCFKLFAVRPDRNFGLVRKGERIGTMLPMQTVFPGITSHIHVQMCDRTDPTQYF